MSDSLFIIWHLPKMLKHAHSVVKLHTKLNIWHVEIRKVHVQYCFELSFPGGWHSGTHVILFSILNVLRTFKIEIIMRKQASIRRAQSSMHFVWPVWLVPRAWWYDLHCKYFSSSCCYYNKAVLLVFQYLFDQEKMLPMSLEWIWTAY